MFSVVMAGGSSVMKVKPEIKVSNTGKHSIRWYGQTNLMKARDVTTKQNVCPLGTNFFLQRTIHESWEYSFNIYHSFSMKCWSWMGRHLLNFDRKPQTLSNRNFKKQTPSFTFYLRAAKDTVCKMKIKTFIFSQTKFTFQKLN